MASHCRVLTINTGSSSLKAAVYDAGEALALVVAAEAGGIGSAAARIRLTRAAGGDPGDRSMALPNQASALDAILDALGDDARPQDVDAIAHRIVHGGRFTSAQEASDEVLAEIRRFVPLDPEHLPQALAAIERLRRTHPQVPEILCFDTAFHRTMPPVARLYALPARFREAGLRRYGFHGLSCEFVMAELRRVEPARAAGRVLIAHLGSGASMTAVRAGASVETTMGFSPAGGLVMGTRPGDMDPGALLFVLGQEPMSSEAAARVINTESGLLAVSGTTADMQDLLAREGSDRRAAEAIALFCYTAKQAIGRLVATLEGLDVLVFTGGIGAHAAAIRARTCHGLACFGLEIDDARNGAGSPIVSTDRSAVVIRVFTTDENLILAEHAAALMAARSNPHV